MLSLRDQAISFSRYILPREERSDQSLWNVRFPVIKTLSRVEPVMYERLHFFRNSKSRNDALSLILITDLLWQLLREISGVSGKQKLPSPGDKFNWVYELHSNLRHPEQLYPDFEWLFNDPWPLKEANKLIDAAEAMDAVLSDITDDFDLGSGFIGEIEEKQKLASVAEANFKENRKLK